MENKDFELLGRYHVAMDEFKKLRNERTGLAHDVDIGLRRAIENYSNQDMNLGLLDHTKLIDKMQELAEVNVKVMQAAELVNNLGEKTDKQKIRIS